LLLYYITDRTQFPGAENARQRALLDKIAEAAHSGVNFIQLREKDLSTRALESLAHAAVHAVRENSPPRTENGGPGPRLLINSRTDVAIACGADGVHLRSDDISPRDARAMWMRSAGALAREKESPVVAVSCHTSSAVARAASQGADFVVFAPVFEKRNTPDVRPAGIDALREACQQSISVLALGGITLENAGSCVQAGAAGIAAIRLFQQNDIAEVVRRLRQ